ncbi:MAG: hypothetical protein DRQ59_13375 [Gammaproteobacteria bacterium]|nr:MAG: hypothetical protein DRQ59_13375 [Gammaproteobacteria bacterium]
MHDRNKLTARVRGLDCSFYNFIAGETLCKKFPSSDLEIWAEYQPVIMALGGKSTYVGDQPAALAVLFAALFTTRQSFMFGMIYGALACQKAGIPLDAFVNQIPVSIKMMQDYYELFAATVPAGDYSNPEASMTTYAAAIDDTLGTFKSLGARSELPQLMHDLVHQGVDSGHGDKQLTGLVKLMGSAS